MGDISAFNELSDMARHLERCAGDRFGTSIPKLPCFFRPQPVVERGEWWTDWCLDLAKVARCDPRPLAQELVDAVLWPSERGTTLRASEGYLVVSSREFPAPSRVALEKRHRVVVVSPPMEEASRWLTMRTAAAAVVHAHLAAVAGETVEVWLGEEHRLVCEGRCSIVQLLEVLSWVWRVRAHTAAQVRSRVEHLCFEAQRANVAVALWCLPSTISHAKFRRWYLRQGESGGLENRSADDGGSFTLCCPSGGWFVDPPQHELDWSILKTSEADSGSGERLWGLALHLAGGQSAREIDQYVGRFAEFDSLPWSLKVAIERLGGSDLEHSDLELYPVIRRESRSALLSSAFYRDAVIFGTVPLFITNIQEVAEDAHRLCSFPPMKGEGGPVDEDRFRRLLSAVCGYFYPLFS